jgi:hypothetical protein
MEQDRVVAVGDGAAAGRRPHSSAALGTTMPPGKACRHRVSAKIKPKLTLMFLAALTGG